MATYTENLVDVTGADLRALIRAAYNLSAPQGLGILHFREGELPDVDVDRILSNGRPHAPVVMDYVNGRSVKFSVKGSVPGHDGRMFVYADRWYDHSRTDLDELLRRIGRDGPEHRVTVEYSYED